LLDKILEERQKHTARVVIKDYGVRKGVLWICSEVHLTIPIDFYHKHMARYRRNYGKLYGGVDVNTDRINLAIVEGTNIGNPAASITIAGFEEVLMSSVKTFDGVVVSVDPLDLEAMMYIYSVAEQSQRDVVIASERILWMLRLIYEKMPKLINKTLIAIEILKQPPIPLPSISLVNEVFRDMKRYLYFVAWLNKFLEERSLGRIIITGGFAVELYTARVYRTMDIDIVAENCGKIVEGFLKRFSEKIGRGYLPTYEILTLKSIDIVSTIYKRRRQPIAIAIDSLRTYVDPVEDLIATYLAGWKYWGSTEDRDKALWLLATWREIIDWSYLEELCREKQALDKLSELIKIVEVYELG